MFKIFRNKKFKIISNIIDLQAHFLFNQNSNLLYFKNEKFNTSNI